MKDHLFDRYRLVSARGIEARKTYHSKWTDVTGHHLEQMRASELQIIVDLLEGNRDNDD